MILDLLDSGEIAAPKPKPLRATAEEQNRVWREVDERRRAGEKRIDVGGVVFEFTRPPPPPSRRRAA